jgi:hypothetical protein
VVERYQVKPRGKPLIPPTSDLRGDRMLSSFTWSPAAADVLTVFLQKMLIDSAVIVAPGASSCKSRGEFAAEPRIHRCR